MALGGCSSACMVSGMGWLGVCEASLCVSVGTEILRFFGGGMFHKSLKNDARWFKVS